MKAMMKLLWVIVAVALVAPTTTWDLQTLLDDSNSRARASDAFRLSAHRADGESKKWQQVTPSPPLQYELCPGDTRTLQYDVHLPPAPIQADILFAFDTTGSMNNVIETAQERAVEIMSNLGTLISDIRFGVIDFRDYPYDPYGQSTDWPYRLRQPLTRHAPYVQMKIEELEGEGGVDGPEAYTRVLYEAYADEHIGWRPEARRFIIVFGDSVPHDDDLNAGIPAPQPHLEYEIWRTGYPPAYVDPGRDAAGGTADDLDFQPVLSALRTNSITLLFIVSDARFEGISADDLLVYWQTWAAMTGSGGDARVLEDLGDLPATIQSLVMAAVRHLDRLTVNVAPSWFEEWVTIVPTAYEDVDIPADGLNRHFEVNIAVPLGVPADHYMFDLIVEADGTVYQRQRVEITVPNTCFATPTPTWAPLPPPKPRRILYIPFVAHDYVDWRHP